ncbi:MAG TPA: TerC family protein [Chloroflexia bacterium]|nr:TerC family protein [Chloroflexia bacterium]
MDPALIALFNIIVIDLLLSGDNAVVIGMAVRGLPDRQRRRAVLLGGAGAIGLRVLLTAVAAFLLQIPLLQAFGGVVLAWITYRLLLPSGEADPGNHKVEATFGAALRTIIIADFTMSLDNVLAVGAAARGDLTLLLIGLGLSMAIILVGGTLVSVLLERMSWLVYVGAAVLLIVAAEMIGKDPVVTSWVGHHEWLPWVYAAVLGLGVGVALLWRRNRQRNRAGATPPESDILQA